MRGDGNGWVRCGLGHNHWGRHGAAGLLLRRKGPGTGISVLMQHRAPWTSLGDTWGLPGGARDSHETAAEAALREAGEEAGVESDAVSVSAEWTDDHGGWAYVTVIADAVRPLTLAANAESAELRWVACHDIDSLPLHPGFESSWPAVRVLVAGS